MQPPPNSKASNPSVRPPRPEDFVQAALCLCEGLPVPDRYLVGLMDLIEGEHVRRLRARKRAA